MYFHVMTGLSEKFSELMTEMVKRNKIFLEEFQIMVDFFNAKVALEGVNKETCELGIRTYEKKLVFAIDDLRQFREDLAVFDVSLTGKEGELMVLKIETQIMKTVVETQNELNVFKSYLNGQG